MVMSLTCAPFLLQGLCSTPRSFHLTNKKLRPRKSGSTMVKAMLELKPPPYPLDALEPHLSKETLEYHWGEHHRGYVKNLNEQITKSELDDDEKKKSELDDDQKKKSELDRMSLEEIIIATYNKGDLLPAFNDAAQVWNHDFFWESMKPGGGGKPSGELLKMIERDFGSFEKFVEDFKLAAATQFGSGWAWLVYKANRLEVGNAVNPLPSEKDKMLVVAKTPNAMNPLVWDCFPLLAIDVWEHAYYLDFENRRADYASIFLEKLVSWETVSSRFESAKAQPSPREMVRQRGIERAARDQAEELERVAREQAEQLEREAREQAEQLEIAAREQAGQLEREQDAERTLSDKEDLEDDTEDDDSADDSADDAEDDAEDAEDDAEADDAEDDAEGDDSEDKK